MKRALVTGITGQDGAYLAALLLEKGYEVHAIRRRSSLFNTARIDPLFGSSPEKRKRLVLHHGDLTDGTSLVSLMGQVRPDEVYNLAAQSHVQVSFDTPEYTADVDALGPLRLLEAVRILGLEKKTRFYQASTSELFGKVREVPQKESTPFYPRSPYGVAKLYGYWITVNYRESYGMFASNGILFNHESPLRGETFVTRKITRAAARIRLGQQKKISLGNLDARRDWGHAKDYVEAMWRMLQHDIPDDFIVASGEAHTVREFAELAFAEAEIAIEWKGDGMEEKGYDQSTGTVVVDVDPEFFRPAEVEFLLGDPSKAKRELGWSPKISFPELVREMVRKDLEEFNRIRFCSEKGFCGYPSLDEMDGKE